MRRLWSGTGQRSPCLPRGGHGGVWSDPCLTVESATRVPCPGSPRSGIRILRKTRTYLGNLPRRTAARVRRPGHHGPATPADKRLRTYVPVPASRSGRGRPGAERHRPRTLSPPVTRLSPAECRDRNPTTPQPRTHDAPRQRSGSGSEMAATDWTRRHRGRARRRPPGPCASVVR